VEVALGTPRGGSLESAHEVSEGVERAIAAELEGANATVHVEPVAASGEGPAVVVRAVADRLGLRVHNLHVYVLSTGVEVELDLELSEEFSLEEAHRHSEALEAAVARELSGPVQLSVHLEPRDDRPVPAIRESSSRARVEAALRELDASPLAVRDVLIVDDGWVVTLKQGFPAPSGLKKVHEAMGELEHALRVLLPEVVRVHVDPELFSSPAGRPGFR
jgi:divalent metal cation (Fe/Co/Zn/Cd) transporter